MSANNLAQEVVMYITAATQPILAEDPWVDPQLVYMRPNVIEVRIAERDGFKWGWVWCTDSDALQAAKQMLEAKLNPYC